MLFRSGSILPLTTILCPAVAGFFLLPVLREFGTKKAFLLYLAASILSLLLVPDKEAALLFVFLLGPYPLLRPKINQLTSTVARVISKLVLCNILIVCVYSLLLFIIAPGFFAAEFGDYTTIGIVVLLVMSNIAFLLYDLCLTRMTFLYEFKLRDKLLRFQRH